MLKNIGLTFNSTLRHGNLLGDFKPVTHMLSQTLFQGLLLWKKIGEGNVVYCPNLNKTQDINLVNTVKAIENMRYNFRVLFTFWHC